MIKIESTKTFKCNLGEYITVTALKTPNGIQVHGLLGGVRIDNADAILTISEETATLLQELFTCMLAAGELPSVSKLL